MMMMMIKMIMTLIILMMMMMIKMIMTLIILMTIIMTLMMQEYSNIGFWRDSDVCSPLPTVTQKGKKCANE